MKFFVAPSVKSLHTNNVIKMVSIIPTPDSSEDITSVATVSFPRISTNSPAIYGINTLRRKEIARQI